MEERMAMEIKLDDAIEARGNSTSEPGPATLQKTPQTTPQKTSQKSPQKTPQGTSRAGKSPRKQRAIQESCNENSRTSEEGDGEEEREDTDEFVGGVEGDRENDRSSGSEETEESEEADWAVEGDDYEEAPDNDHLCIHCKYDEDHDQASDYEETLECAVCSVFSHRSCDRSANENGAVKSAYNKESSTWRCPNCAASGLEPGSTVPPRTPRVRPKSPAKDKASGRLRKRKSDELEEEDGPIGTRRRKRRDKSKANGIIEDVADDEGEPDDSTLLNGATRKRRKLDRKPVVTIKLVPGKLMVHIGGLDPNKLAMVAKEKSRPIRGRGARNNTPAVKQKVNTTANQDLPTASTTLYPVIYDEDKSKPYGGILSEPDAVTKDTLPGSSERAQFETAKKKGEEEKKMRTQIMDRITKSNTQGRPGSDQETKRVGEASLIESIHFGEYEIDTWYAAPYPEEYSLNKILWICEFCLKYMNSEYVCWRHKLKCPAKHPPGDEIYRDGSVSVFEIDGRKQPVYCQNLCLMAKLFLGSKTLYYDVHPFLFYVMTERDELGMHLVGYFSKEKREGSQNNVSCIITLPIHQRKGYGNLLIDFSYLLTRVEKRTGSPEKPFSDLGLVSYRNYWKLRLCYELRHQRDPLTIGDLSKRTGMTTDDIICGLEALNALVRDPVTGYYALRLDHALFEAQIERWEAKGYIKLNPKALIWTPYLMGRSQAEHLNEMPLTTIAPRAGELPRDPKNDHETAGEQRDEVMKLNPLLAAHDALAAPDGGMNGRISQLTDSIDPTLIANRPVPQLVSSIDNTQSQEFLSQLREIPPTRFEIVPPPPGSAVQRRAGVFRGTGRGRGRPRLASPAVRGTGKGRYGATPATATRRTGKTKLADVESVAATPAPKPRRIVTKAPRMRSLTADLARAGSTSEGSLRGGGKGNIKSVSGVVAAAATSTASSSSSSSVSSSSSSASASTDGI